MSKSRFNINHLKQNISNKLILSLLLACCAILFALNISLGSVSIPFMETVKVLLGQSVDSEVYPKIIYNFRLPKALTAVLAGSALSLSGLMMQSFFRNPLAGPYVLGISSGASLGVAILMMVGLSLGSFLPFDYTQGWSLIISAALGSAAVFSLVMLVSIRMKNPVILLILGLMFGSGIGAIVSVIQFFSKADDLQQFVIWGFGSLGGLTWSELKILAPVIALGLFVALLTSKDLNAISLGENYAQSMGLPLAKLRFMVVVATSILAGGITAFCGPIAFIGIGVPHVARFLFRSSDHRILMPGSLLCGVGIMLLCDIIAQLPGSVYVLPINSVTSLLGAPLVIFLVLRGKSIRNSFN